MDEINLIESLRGISEKEKAMAEKARLFSLVALMAYSLVAAGIFSFWLILQRKDGKVTEGIMVQESKIEGLEEKESRHIFLKQRLSNLLPFFTEEEIKYEEIITQLETFLTEGTLFEKIEFGDERELTIDGNANNAIALAGFIEQLLSQGDDLAENISLTSATRQDDGSYNFSLFLNVKTGAKS